MIIENPAFDYDTNRPQYARHRQTDPRIEAVVHAALGNAATVLNVGAGAGSYEPRDRYVVAVEPSANMRMQRLANGKVPAVDASAEALPFDDLAFDAAMATVTLHQWQDKKKGLQELRRVTKGPVVILTADPNAFTAFWGASYFPELVAIERQRFPSLDTILEGLGGKSEVVEVPIPLDCKDGFQEAFYGRPEAFLDAEVRKAQSAWGFLEPGMEDILVDRLKTELENGTWDRKYGHLRKQAEFTGSLTLVVSKGMMPPDQASKPK